MRKNINSMIGFSIMATDGELGEVIDFYFDDESWTMRYMVVQASSWLRGRKVLISFASIKKIDCEASAFLVDLSCDQVRNSPDIDTNSPVYRQHELELHEHYMLQPYWIDVSVFALGINNDSFLGLQDEEENTSEPPSGDQHLRSARQIEGYLIHATDGEIGHAKDFIIDLENWLITFLIVDTRNLLAGRKVLLSTQDIKSIEWTDSEVYVNISRGAIIESPEFDLDKDL